MRLCSLNLTFLISNPVGREDIKRTWGRGIEGGKFLRVNFCTNLICIMLCLDVVFRTPPRNKPAQIQRSTMFIWSKQDPEPESYSVYFIKTYMIKNQRSTMPNLLKEDTESYSVYFIKTSRIQSQRSTVFHLLKHPGYRTRDLQCFFIKTSRVQSQRSTVFLY